MRQDQHLRRKADRFGAGGEKSEHDEGVVKEVLRRIAVAPVGTVGDIGAEYVVGSPQVVVSEPFRSLGKVTNGCRFAADIDEWQCDADLHGNLPIVLRTRCSAMSRKGKQALAERHNPNIARAS